MYTASVGIGKQCVGTHHHLEEINKRLVGTLTRLVEINKWSVGMLTHIEGTYTQSEGIDKRQVGNTYEEQKKLSYPIYKHIGKLYK